METGTSIHVAAHVSAGRDLICQLTNYSLTTHVNLNVYIILAWGSAMATITLYHINVHVCLLLYVELDNEYNLSNNQDYSSLFHLKLAK